MSTQFERDMAKKIGEIKGINDRFVRKLVLDLGTSLVMNSPVGNPTLWLFPNSAPKGYIGGRFRANWQLGINVNPKGTTDTVDKSGGATVGKIAAGALQGKAGDSFFIVNNLPYARRLEYGHSTQTPAAGIVGTVEVQFRDFVKKALQSAKSKGGRG